MSVLLTETDKDDKTKNIYNAASSKITLVLIAIDFSKDGKTLMLRDTNASGKDPQGNYYRLSIADDTYSTSELLEKDPAQLYKKFGAINPLK